MSEYRKNLEPTPLEQSIRFASEFAAGMAVSAHLQQAAADNTELERIQRELVRDFSPSLDGDELDRLIVENRKNINFFAAVAAMNELHYGICA